MHSWTLKRVLAWPCHKTSSWCNDLHNTLKSKMIFLNQTLYKHCLNTFQYTVFSIFNLKLIWRLLLLKVSCRTRVRNVSERNEVLQEWILLFCKLTGVQHSLRRQPYAVEQCARTKDITYSAVRIQCRRNRNRFVVSNSFVWQTHHAKLYPDLPIAAK